MKFGKLEAQYRKEQSNSTLFSEDLINIRHGLNVAT